MKEAYRVYHDESDDVKSRKLRWRWKEADIKEGEDGQKSQSS
jgi:hypothetical protein